MPPAPLGPRAIVAPPPVSAPLHGLLSSARSVSEPDDRWELGLTFRPESYAQGAAWDPRRCNDDGTENPVADKSVGTQPGLEEFDPYIVEIEERCSTWGFPSSEFEQRARRQLEAAQGKQIEHEFWTGTINQQNFSLARACTVQAVADGIGILNPNPTTSGITPFTPWMALAKLNQGLADAGPGSRGMIHASALLVELWAQADYLQEDRSGRLITKSRGTIVVSGSGYPGTGPEGHPKQTPDPDTEWAFATRLVDIRLGAVQVYPDNVGDATDKRTNTIAYRAERTAAAAPDRGAVLAALVTLL